MPRGIVIYHSRSGSTKKMAESIGQGMSESGLQTDVVRVEDTSIDSIEQYDAIVVGSPTQYGSMAWQIKKLFDDSANLHYKLDGKVGGAFSSSCHVGGGNETTVLGIIQAMLIHGMVIQGDPMYDHYGAVSLTNPSEDNLMKCRKYGNRIGSLTNRL